jgi:hypothetical protein
MALEPHQQRVVTELEELKERTRKLEAFLKSDKYESLDLAERLLLLKQVRLMVRLESCLQARIRYWEERASAERV